MEELDLLKKGNKINEYRHSLIEDKNKRILELKNKQNKLDSKITQKYRLFKIFIIFISILTISIPAYCLDFNNLASWASIISLLPLIGIFIFTIIFEKSINVIEILNNHKNKIQYKIYLNNDYNENEISKLEDDILKLNQEI